MGDPDPKKPFQNPEAPIKARDGLTPMAVAKLAQARIKTLADVKRLTEDDLKRLPLALSEYAAVKKFIASISFEGEAGEQNAGTAPNSPAVGTSQAEQQKNDDSSKSA